ncbi:MAG: hypothetical protein PHT69_15465 [Bacteroidales bacterium]|nr:hypothetical protein [Bacteroidales bacterium]
MHRLTLTIIKINSNKFSSNEKETSNSVLLFRLPLEHRIYIKRFSKNLMFGLVLYTSSFFVTSGRSIPFIITSFPQIRAPQIFR